MSEEVLRMEGISKYFGTFAANDNVSLTLGAGEVHTLLGENGAGKSTLMNILVGMYQPTSGKIFIRGKEVSITSPAVAEQYGIGMVHQHFMLVEDFTGLDNIILGTKEAKTRIINRRAVKPEIMALAEKYMLEVDLDRRITDISVGEQQRIEILKLLYRGADILILDEPTAVLTNEESQQLFNIIGKLTGEGKSVIFISHKMREVMKISDRVTVLRLGKNIDTVEKENLDAEDLATKMVGHKIQQVVYEKGAKDESFDVVKLEHVSYNKESKHEGLNDISFTIKRGEIFGIAGVDGNGQSELAKLVTGNIRPDEGKLWLYSHLMTKFNTKTFIDKNVAHIPEDRNRMGLIGTMTVQENLVLKVMEWVQYSAHRGLYLRHKALAKHTDEMLVKYDIRCQSPQQEARSLSGGNQQKVILAREMELNPGFLIAVHPTRGLDIGATQFIHDELVRAKNNGCAVLLISADLDEVLKMADRIGVMYEGSIVGQFPGKDAPVKSISLAMAGKREGEADAG